jgi:hypothetical protein
MAKKYTVVDAPRRVRLRWARKAAITRRANKKLRECKAQLVGCSQKLEAAPILSSGRDMRRYDYMSPEVSQYDELAESAPQAAAEYVGYGYSANPCRRRSLNPELMVVHNPGRHYRSRAGRVSLSVRHRRNNMRRKSRNLPLTVKIGRKRHTYRRFIRAAMKGGKMTMKQAARKWKRSKKFHGYSKKRVSRNSWKGHRKAHARAARKGWRKRRMRRMGRSRRRCKANRWMKLVKKYGVKKAKRHYRCKRRKK